MNGNSTAFLRRVSMVTDAAAAAAAYLFGRYVWLGLIKGGSNAAQGTFMPFLFAACVLLAMLILNFYSDEHFRRKKILPFRVFAGCVMAALLMVILLYVFHISEFSRGVLLISAAACYILLLLKNAVLGSVLGGWIKKAAARNVLVVGTGELARRFSADIAADPESGIRVIGFCGDASGNLPVVCSYPELDGFLGRDGIDEVVVAIDGQDWGNVRGVINSCEHNGTKMYVIPFYNDLIPSHPTLECIGGSKLINLRANPLDNMSLAMVKRAFDICFSGFLLLVLSPLFAVLALGTRLSSPGPVFFKQERVGRNKKNFMMYKFRSMKVNSSEKTGWTTDNDSRKTRFGSLIRKFSLDELPQLWNVLKGDMSVIGPRPEIPFYVERFKESVPRYMVKHQVRPGMTGWAQINGWRGNTSIEKRIEYDVWYIENWSLGLDIRILFRTALGGFKNPESLK